MSDPILFRLSELERKVKGGTLANARAARLERELASLRNLAEKDFNSDFITAKINELEKGLADHEIRISGMEGSVEVLIDETARAHARVSDVEKIVAEDRKISRDAARRLTVLETETTGGFSFAGLVIAVITGIVAGLLWARHDWGSTFTVGNRDGTAESAADLAISAWLFGAGFGLAALALFTLFSNVSNKTRYEQESVSQPRTQVPAKDVPPPTEVHPAQVARTS